MSVAPRAAVARTEVLAAFNGSDLAGQVSRFGPGQGGEPPDTQIAAGPDSVVEATNAQLAVWSKAGALISATDLNVMFGLTQPTYFFSDPRVLYDSPSGRWFLTGLAFGTSSNISLLAVSGTSDPSASWLIYYLATSTNLPDQPKVGVTADKVVISWNDFSNPTTFAGQQTWVVEKSDLLTSRSPLRSVSFGPDATRFSTVPAILQTPSNAEFVVYNGNMLPGGTPCGGFYACVGRITGTPAGLDVLWAEIAVPIRPTITPPNAAQPGSATTIQTNDDRFLSADWRDGKLWIAGNDRCTPAGDTAARACLRLVQLNATDTAASLAQDLEIGSLSAYAYFPAVATDLLGNLFVSFTGSSATLNLPPSAEAISMPVGGTAYTSVVIGPGQGPYDTTGTTCRGTNRWGDYSGAATDPSNPNDIWVAAERTPSTNTCNWGTSIARLTLAAPTISSLAPPMGPQRGGTAVTITGTEFGLGDTSVSFGGTALPPSSVTLDSPQQVRAVSPPHPGCGSVAVTVTTSRGTSAPATFGYVGWPCAASPGTGSSFRGRVPPPKVR